MCNYTGWKSDMCVYCMDVFLVICLILFKQRWCLSHRYSQLPWLRGGGGELSPHLSGNARWPSLCSKLRLRLSAGGVHVTGTSATLSPLWHSCYRCSCDFVALVTSLWQVQVLLCLPLWHPCYRYRCYFISLLVPSLVQVQMLLFLPLWHPCYS